MVKLLRIIVVCLVLASASMVGTDKPYQVGTASWYGKSFEDRWTASGEKYNMFDLTAAHKTLPFNTYVKVTVLRSGEWVIVRINDRGPYAGNRIIDLSYAAARSIHLRGVEKVRLDVSHDSALSSYIHQNKGVRK